MPTWPTTPLAKDKLDEAGDNPSQARVQLLAAIEAIEDILDLRGVAGGIAPLDGDGTIPSAYLSGTAIISKLLDVDGASSGLDADLLDGLHGSAYARRDLTTEFEATSGYPMRVEHSTAYTTTHHTGLSLYHETSGTPADGFGLAIALNLKKAAGGERTAAQFVARWDDASSNHSSLDIWACQSDTPARQLRLQNYHLEYKDVDPGASYPASGYVWVYAKGGSLYYRTSTTEVGPLAASAGGTSHSALIDLDADDHTQYLLVDGTRAMAGELTMGANAFLCTELGAKPSQPGAGEWKLYFKAAGLFIEDDNGTETQIAAGGVTVHDQLTGLGDDDHTQYVLRQPTADTIINEAGGDFDFRVEGDTIDNLFHLVAGYEAIGMGVTPASATIRLRVVHTGGNTGIQGESDAGSGVVGTTNTGSAITGSAASTGRAGYFVRNAATSTPTMAVVEILDDNSTYGFRALYVKQDAPDADVARFDVATGEAFTIHPSEITFNEAGLAEMDVRIEGDTLTHLLHVDTSTDTVAINGPLTTARLNVSGGALDAIYATTGQTGKRAGRFVATGSADGVYGSAVSGTGVYGSADPGKAGYFARNTLSAATDPVVLIETQSASDAGPLLKLIGAGTGQLLDIWDAGTRIFEMEDPGGYYGVITNWRECDSAPPQAATGFWRVYFLSDGMYYRDDAGSAPVGPLGGGGGGGTFISLTDTPSSYTGQGNKVLTVNNVANAVEFTDLWYEAGTLAFVGTTSSYPALKRSTNTLEAWLADSSAYTDFGAKRIVLHATATITLAAPTSAGTTTYTFPATPDNGKYLKTDATGALSWDTPAGSGADEFTDLIDTPSSYSGQASKLLAVNSVPDAVEFASLYYASATLKFEGTTSIYPALKRSTTNLQVRLADDSTWTTLEAASLVLWSTPAYIDFGTSASNPAIRLTTTGGSFVDALSVDRGSWVPVRAAEIRTCGVSSGYVGHKGQADAGSTIYVWPNAPDNGKYLKTDGSGNLSWDTPTGGAALFTDHTDTPSSYSGQAGKLVQVNATPDALIFSNLTIDTSDKLKWPDDTDKAKLFYYSNTHGVGTETGGVITQWATVHRWRIGGTTVSGGVEKARLNTTGLRLGAAADAQRTLHIDYQRYEPSGAPGSPVEGDVYADSGTHKFMFHTGSAWQALGNVFGPGTSTQYAVPRYSDTTGTALLNSTILINASDQLRQKSGGDTKWGLSATDEIFLLANDVMINWRNAADIDAGVTDTGLRRDAAVGVVAITDGTIGGYGKARAMEFAMYDGSTNFVTHKAAAISADVAYAWPGAPSGTYNWYLRSDGGGNLDWEPLPKWERTWTAGDFDVLETNIPPLEKITGTNTKLLVRAFDYNTVEYLNGRFKVPSALVDTGSSTVTFRAIWYARTAPASSENVVWAFAHIAKADNEDWDSTSETVEQASADAASTTQDVLTVTTWTETLTNLGWAADEIVLFRLYRNSTDAGDTLDTRADEDDDAMLLSFTIEIPVD